jgi:hypothetical protein
VESAATICSSIGACERKYPTILSDFDRVLRAQMIHSQVQGSNILSHSIGRSKRSCAELSSSP